MSLLRRSAKARPKRTDFEAVVEAYERRLISYAARVTGSRAAAEDIAQEAFIKLSRAWDGALAPGPAVAAWLYKTAHNAAVDHIRREKVRAEAQRRHHQEREDGDAEAADARADAAWQCADAAAAREALDALSGRERSLVILKVYEGKTYKEIADITGLSRGNVGFILHTAMRKLANFIAERRRGADS